MAIRSCAVIGLGLFGRKVATTLADLGVEVLAVDRNADLVHAMGDRVASAVCADITDEKALVESGVLAAEVAVVAIGENMESSILVTALLKKHGVRRIVARSHSDLHALVLSTVGAERTIDPEEEMGVRLAQEIWAPDVHSRIRLTTGQEVLEIEAREPLVGRTIQDLKFREKYRLNILAVKHRKSGAEAGGAASGFEVNKLPRPTDIVESWDVLVVVGDSERVQQFLDLL